MDNFCDISPKRVVLILEENLHGSVVGLLAYSSTLVIFTAIFRFSSTSPQFESYVDKLTLM